LVKLPCRFSTIPHVIVASIYERLTGQAARFDDKKDSQHGGTRPAERSSKWSNFRGSARFGRYTDLVGAWIKPAIL
jgi:hypothetical protein